VIDRFYFRSVYFREPGGILYEIASVGPGFTSDEPLESLGERLSLPPAPGAGALELGRAPWTSRLGGCRARSRVD
jgi:glyoxalase family protein